MKEMNIETPFDNKRVDRDYMKKDHQSENSSGLEYADSILGRVSIHFSVDKESIPMSLVVHPGMGAQNGQKEKAGDGNCPRPESVNDASFLAW